MRVPLTFHDLKILLRSAHPIVVGTSASRSFRDALLTAAGDLGRSLMTWSPSTGLVSEPHARVVDRTGDAITLLRRLRTISAPSIVHVRGLSAGGDEAALVRSLRDLAAHFAGAGSSLVIGNEDGAVASSVMSSAVPVTWRPAPSEDLGAAVDACLGVFAAARHLEAPVDRAAIVAALDGATVNQARQAVAAVAWAEGRLTGHSVPRLVEWRARLVAGGTPIELFPAEDNRFELGGFGRFKAWMARARASLGPGAPGLGRGAPGNLLIAGVEGCGKSLAVRVLARECRVPLVRVNVARLEGRVGAERRRLEDGFRLSTALAPSVLWVDGLERLGPGGASSSGLRTLLGWMKARPAQVLMAATTADLWALPDEVLADGVFDDRFYVDLPDAAERDAILRIHLMRRRQPVETIDLSRAVDASGGCAGRELEQAIVAAVHRTAFRSRELDTDAVLHEFRQAIPLSANRGEHLDRLREMARGRFVPTR